MPPEHAPLVLLLAALAASATGLYALTQAQRTVQRRFAERTDEATGHALATAQLAADRHAAQHALERLYVSQRTALEALVAHGHAVAVPPLPPLPPAAPQPPKPMPTPVPLRRWALAGLAGSLAAAALLWWAASMWGAYGSGQPFSAGNVRDASVWAWLGGGTLADGGGGGQRGRLVLAAWAVGVGTLVSGLAAWRDRTSARLLPPPPSPQPSRLHALTGEALHRSDALSEALAALGEADRRHDGPLQRASCAALTALLATPLPA